MKHPECVLDESLSILTGYLSRLPSTFQSNSETKETAAVSISSDNPVEMNGDDMPSFHSIEFEGMFSIEDPGSILIFVDHYRIYRILFIP